MVFATKAAGAEPIDCNYIWYLLFYSFIFAFYSYIFCLITCFSVFNHPTHLSGLLFSSILLFFISIITLSNRIHYWWHNCALIIFSEGISQPVLLYLLVTCLYNYYCPIICHFICFIVLILCSMHWTHMGSVYLWGEISQIFIFLLLYKFYYTFEHIFFLIMNVLNPKYGIICLFCPMVWLS